MCRGGWQSLQGLNPGRAHVSTREYIDERQSFLRDTRGGPKTAKHVEILGNHEVISDILHVAAGQDEHLVSSRIFSRIDEISQRVTQRLRSEQPTTGDAPW